MTEFPPAPPRRRRALPVLELAGLRVVRGSTIILDDVGWSIQRGQHWAILGANGSGKTSLLKALTGFLSPTAGEFSVLGRRYGASDWRKLRLEIGIVTSAFTAAIPAAENAVDTVMSGKFAQLDLWSRVTAADKSAALKWLRVVGASHIAERPWIYLSQGERQRVLIARALMARPKLLILDEPCAGLDPVAREEFLQLLSRIGRRRDRGAPALVLVTHHVEEITDVFTHALLLRRGRVVAAGTVKRVLNAPNLTATFGAKMSLARKSGRYQLHLSARR